MLRSLVLLAILVLAGCAEPATDAAGPATDPVPLPAVPSTGDFDGETYRLLAEDPGNVFLSPVSIRVAMAMVAEATRGESQQQLLDAMGFATMEEARAWAQAAAASFAATEEVRLETANAVWPSTAFPVRPEYVEAMETDYDALAEALDYRADPEAARERINGWVEGRTEDRIQGLFPPGTITADTIMAWVNAIYFKGDWATPFNATLTEEAPFTTADGDVVQVPMMHMPHRHRDTRHEIAGYAEDGDIRILELPYEGGNVSFVAILPGVGNMSALEERLDQRTLDGWADAAIAQRQAVDIMLPKLEVETKYDLLPPLKALGVRDVFLPGRSDFSGMTDVEAIVINVGVHQAFVKIDEEGTEAAAATGFGAVVTSVPPPAPQFHADRPFVFVVRDNPTGTLLFMGRVADPS